MWLQLDLSRRTVVDAVREQAAAEVESFEIPVTDIASDLLQVGQLPTLPIELTLKFKLRDIRLATLAPRPKDIRDANGNTVKPPGKLLGVVADVHPFVHGLPTGPLGLPYADVTFRADVNPSGTGLDLSATFEDFEFTGSTANFAGKLVQARQRVEDALAGQTFGRSFDLSMLYEQAELDPAAHPMVNTAIAPRGFGEPKRVSVLLDVAPITTPPEVAAEVWGMAMSSLFKSVGDLDGAAAGVTLWHDAAEFLVKDLLKKHIVTEVAAIPDAPEVKVIDPRVRWRTKGVGNFVFDKLECALTVRAVIGKNDWVDLPILGVATVSLSGTDLKIVVDGKAGDPKSQGALGWFVEKAAEVAKALLTDDGRFLVTETVAANTDLADLGTLAPTSMSVFLFNSHFRDPQEKYTHVVPVTPDVLPLEPMPGAITVVGALTKKPTSKVSGSPKVGQTKPSAGQKLGSRFKLPRKAGSVMGKRGRG